MNELELFTDALARTDPAERAAFLDEVCAGNPDLRRRMDELLSGHARGGSPLDRPPVDPVGFVATATFDPSQATATFAPDAATGTYGDHTHAPVPSGSGVSVAPGTVIAGRYTLVEVIGEGGMGSVYLASQTEPVKRQVALKLIKSGMDSRNVLARFDAERQALAMMDHPNIARIYDGGVTPSGQPFFVMELVRGVPLTEYCDAKRLTVDARLQLFVAVCQAVQHAHQKGIIHRDLKPSNVLVAEVDGRPTPKVIDFGVAKATELKLTDMSFADTGAIVGTPAYMSPEQADPMSMDIDTRTDVYALGVMLYELLTGSSPIDSKQFKRGAILEMLRMVREVDPPRPSTRLSTADALPNIAACRSIDPAKLAKLLRGELDWVVMKALEKDRTRRYDTANGLARDIQRYLADEVVEARPPSRGYRLKKFVTRNKGQVVAASLVLLALVAGVVGTAVGLIEAERQTAHAVGETALKEEARIAAVTAQKAEAERAEGERRSVYISRISRAGDALRNGNVAQVRASLESTLPIPGEPDYRGWEWYCLDNLVNRIDTRYRYHFPGQGRTQTPGLSADGGLFALWKLRAKSAPDQPGQNLDGNPGTLVVMNSSAPERELLSFDGLFDLNSDGLGLSATAGRVVWASGTQVRVIDLKTGKVATEWKLEHPVCGKRGYSNQTDPFGTDHVNVSNCALDDTGSRAAITLSVPLPKDQPPGLYLDSNAIDVWDVAKATRLFRYTPPADFDPVKVLIGPGGKRLAILGMPRLAEADFERDGDPQAVPRRAFRWEMWDIDTGKQVWQTDEPRGDQAWPGAFSPDGKRLYGARGNRILVRDAATGADLLLLPPLATEVMALAASPDGRTIAAGERTGAVALIDVPGQYPVERLHGHESGILELAFHKEPAALVSVSNDGFIHRQALSGRSLRPTETPIAKRRGNDETSQDGKFSWQPLPQREGRAVVEVATGRRVFHVPVRDRATKEHIEFAGFTADGLSFLRQVFPLTVRDAKGRVDPKAPPVAPPRLIRASLATGKIEWDVPMPRPSPDLESSAVLGMTPDGLGILIQTFAPPPVIDKRAIPTWQEPPFIPTRLTRRNLATGAAEWDVAMPAPDGLDRWSTNRVWHRFSPDLTKVVWVVPPVIEYTAVGRDKGTISTGKVKVPAEVRAWSISPDGVFTRTLSHTLSWHFGADATTVGTVGDHEVPKVEYLDNTSLVVGNAWNAQLFDLATGKAFGVCRGEGLAGARFGVAPDGSRLFGLRGGRLTLWDVRTGDEVVRIPGLDKDRSGRGDRTMRIVGSKVVVESPGGSNPFTFELDGTPRAVK